MSLIAFHPLDLTKISELEGNCGFCFESFKETKNKEVLVHDSEGKKDMHPIHRTCIRQWAKTSQTCPFFCGNIDLNSTYTTKELSTKRLKYFTSNTLLPVASSAITSLITTSIISTISGLTLSSKLGVISSLIGAIYMEVATREINPILDLSMAFLTLPTAYSTVKFAEMENIGPSECCFVIFPSIILGSVTTVAAKKMINFVANRL